MAISPRAQKIIHQLLDHYYKRPSPWNYGDLTKLKRDSSLSREWQHELNSEIRQVGKTRSGRLTVDDCQRMLRIMRPMLKIQSQIRQTRFLGYSVKELFEVSHLKQFPTWIPYFANLKFMLEDLTKHDKSIQEWFDIFQAKCNKTLNRQDYHQLGKTVKSIVRQFRSRSRKPYAEPWRFTGRTK
jgi:hypothetical protein